MGDTIRRVQEKVGVLRHQIEQGIRDTIFYDAPVMAWMVRWAAELLSKYSPGDDGKIPFERIRNETCVTPCVPYGETIMYLPLQTVACSKGEPIKKQGVWLGTIERTEEVTVGTKRGVVKCRTVNRLAANERWDKDMVLGMKGVPWETILGQKGRHIPVAIIEDGRELCEEDENNKMLDNDQEGDEPGLKLRGGLDRLHISKKAVNRYGTPPGCPACNEIERRGHTAGRIGYNHNETCRRRIFNEMTKEIQNINIW